MKLDRLTGVRPWRNLCVTFGNLLLDHRGDGVAVKGAWRRVSGSGSCVAASC